jgi:hypothetical protein
MGVREVSTEPLRPLAWARIGVALVLLLRTTPVLGWFLPGLADANPLLGWPHAGHRVAAFGLSLPVFAIQGLCIVRTVAALAFLVGFRALPMGIVAGFSGYLVLLQDAYAFTFTQHLLLLGTVVLALADSATVLAVRPDRPRSPASSLWLVHGFTVSVYFWAAVVKLRRDWLDGRTLGLFFDEGALAGPLAGLLVGTPSRRAVAGPLVVATELSLVGLLLWPRTRVIGLAVALGLHASIEWMARPDVIGWGMCALLLAFVPNEKGSSVRAMPFG